MIWVLCKFHSDTLFDPHFHNYPHAADNLITVLLSMFTCTVIIKLQSSPGSPTLQKKKLIKFLKVHENVLIRLIISSSYSGVLLENQLLHKQATKADHSGKLQPSIFEIYRLFSRTKKLQISCMINNTGWRKQCSISPTSSITSVSSKGTIFTAFHH